MEITVGACHLGDGIRSCLHFWLSSTLNWNQLCFQSIPQRGYASEFGQSFQKCLEISWKCTFSYKMNWTKFTENQEISWRLVSLISQSKVLLLEACKIFCPTTFDLKWQSWPWVVCQSEVRIRAVSNYWNNVTTLWNCDWLRVLQTSFHTIPWLPRIMWPLLSICWLVDFFSCSYLVCTVKTLWIGWGCIATRGVGVTATTWETATC